MHKLCHVLNMQGHSSFLTPAFQTYEMTRRDVFRPLAKVARSQVRAHKNYLTNPDLNTPVIRSPRSSNGFDDYVVVYPEVVAGNPLQARNVVRWLLYTPGVLTSKIHYGPAELYVPYNNSFADLQLPGSKTLKDELRIVHYPLHLYFPPPEDVPRSGMAHLIRKGADKPQSSHEHDSICIDGLSHSEIARIFRTVQTFVSYDSYSAYSYFAALSGCDSVVIPDDGVDEEAWYADPEDRAGIAYGWAGLDHARRTRHRVLPRLEAQERGNIAQVERFVANVDEFFDSR
jgi:hypothetical protein